VPAIASGDRRLTTVRTGEGWVVLTRGAPEEGAETVDVVAVRGDDDATVPLEGSGHHVVLSWDPVSVAEAGTAVHIPGPGFAVLVRD
jgi:maltooligosyltrehalose trehalohydrolase